MLAFGAIAGISIGVLVQPVLDVVDADIRGLVRVVMLLPGLVFTVWWLLSPRPALEQEARDADLPGPEIVDVQERIEYIESTFDPAAVPAARRSSIEHVNDEARETLRRTLPRDRGHEHVDAASFGLRGHGEQRSTRG